MKIVIGIAVLLISAITWAIANGSPHPFFGLVLLVLVGLMGAGIIINFID